MLSECRIHTTHTYTHYAVVSRFAHFSFEPNSIFAGIWFFLLEFVCVLRIEKEKKICLSENKCKPLNKLG